jgi:hypothetical protein
MLAATMQHENSIDRGHLLGVYLTTTGQD